MSTYEYSKRDLVESLLRALAAEQEYSLLLHETLVRTYDRLQAVEAQLAALRAQVKQALPTKRLDS